jgi:hypothetical protein
MSSDEQPPVSASHHCLSGSRHGQVPVYSLPQRANAAFVAGIGEIGACADDLGQWNHRELRRLVRDRAYVAELEWVDLGDVRDPVAEDALFALADLFSSRQLNVGVCDPAPVLTSYLAKRLKHLARRAADHNLTVAFEPVAFGSVADVTQVQHIIERAAEPNIGTLLDVYHMGRYCWDGLQMVDPELVTAIQISGLNRTPAPSWPYGLLEEAQCRRLLPGEGEFPLMTWLEGLRDRGVQARLSAEVLSDDLRAMTLFGAASAVAAAAAPFTRMWAVS